MSIFTNLLINPPVLIIIIIKLLKITYFGYIPNNNKKLIIMKSYIYK